VDLPHCGNNLSFDGGDKRMGASDENTIANTFQHIFGQPASPQLPQALTPALRQCLLELGLVCQRHCAEIMENIHILDKQLKYNAVSMVEMLNTASTDNARYYNILNSKMDSLLQKMDAAWTENTTLREAYHASREETALLMATVDTLTKRFDENIGTTTPPSPESATTSSAMEEITMQLAHIQNDIQDVLDAVCNPPGKRK
jgi:hypothetical protein